MCLTSYGGLQCNTSTGYQCATDTFNNLVEETGCITYDNLTCYSDQGQLCNYTGSNQWCNI